MPSTIDSATAAIEGHLRASLPGVPCRFPNAPFTVPAGVLWLDCDVLFGTGVLRSMGDDRRNAVVGIVHINIYQAESIGQGQARRVGDKIRDVFNRKRLISGTGEPISFLVPSGLVGHRQEAIESKAWDVSSITVSFDVEELVG